MICKHCYFNVHLNLKLENKANLKRMSLAPDWNFETVKPKEKSKPEAVVQPPPVPKAVKEVKQSPRVNRSPPTSFVDKEKSRAKVTVEPEVEKKNSALYEVVAPILTELKRLPRYQQNVRTNSLKNNVKFFV